MLVISRKSENSRPKKLKEIPKLKIFYETQEFCHKLRITGKFIFTNNLLDLKIKFTCNKILTSGSLVKIDVFFLKTKYISEFLSSF